MSFKGHLLIICGIIVFMYVILQVMQKKPDQQAVKVEEKSPYSISILHASWGLNCLNSYDYDPEPTPSSFAGSPKSKWVEDNVLTRVDALCKDKKGCVIGISKDVLGDVPDAENCGTKELKVEYRCFSFDRPWIIISKDKDKELVIDCEKQNKSTQ